MGLAAGQIARDTDFSALPGRMIAYGSRGTNSTATTTEQGVIRLDNITVVSGHRYVLVGTAAVTSTVTGDQATTRMRVSTSGVATTASTQVGAAPGTKMDNTMFLATGATATYLASVTGTISVLFSVVRLSGTGNVTAGAPSEFFVLDGGQNPASTVSTP